MFNKFNIDFKFLFFFFVKQKNKTISPTNFTVNKTKTKNIIIKMHFNFVNQFENVFRHKSQPFTRFSMLRHDSKKNESVIAFTHIQQQKNIDRTTISIIILKHTTLNKRKSY
jgi:hypothetical protein